MTIRDLVLISLGEIFLCATFALGVLVGCSLRRKESTHGYCDENKEWRDFGRRDTEDGAR